MPAPIASLAREILRDPVSDGVGRPVPEPAAGIAHAAYPVASGSRPPCSWSCCEEPGVRSALVFTRTKHRANRVAEFLVKRGVPADRIHGNRSQAQRTQALARFRAGPAPVLVATDIAARGIDVTGLSHVVNFDVPGSAEDYVHRVGPDGARGGAG